MPFCPSGVSQPKAGSAPTMIVGTAYLAALPAIAGTWFVPAVEALGGTSIYELPTFCAADPPADPGVSGLDIVAVLTAAPEFENPGARARVQQLINRFLWGVVCECATSTTPAPPAFPAAPSGLPSYNPPGVGGVGPGVCHVDSLSESVPSGLAGYWELLSGQQCDATGHPTCASLRQPIPAGAVSVQVFSDVRSAPGTLGTAAVYFYDATPALLGPVFMPNTTVSSFASGQETVYSNVVAVPPTATSYIVRSNSQSFASSDSVQVSFYCSASSPVQAASPCCTATDTGTQAMLQQILTLVTLLQRQVAPFAYVSGPIHSGLTGNGTIAVQGLLGVLLNTSIPARAGFIIGDPVTAYDVGWINFGTASGFTERHFITSDSQVIFPSDAGVYTLVGYTLLQGVTCAITELRREA